MDTQGFITAVKETFGFITYGQRDTRLYFRLSELLNPEEPVRPNDEVEFTVAQVCIFFYILKGYCMTCKTFYIFIYLSMTDINICMFQK